MEKITTDLKHPKETYLLALSRLFERAGYYGIRALFVIYLLGKTIKMDQVEAFEIYGVFTILVYLFQLIGGIFGDFILKNKNAILIGGILEFFGTLIICIPSIYSFYIGIGIFALGAGLFSPNIIAEFGKIYNNKEKLLDAGYNIFYFAINIGSFIGIATIGYLGNIKTYYGFILASLFFIIAIILTKLVKKAENNVVHKSKYEISHRVIAIIGSIILSVLFWGIYEITSSVSVIRQFNFSDITKYELPNEIWIYLSQSITIFFGIILIIIWSLFYTSQIYKLIFGFILGIISITILFYIPDNLTDADLSLFLFAMLFLGISELFIAPILLAVLAKYANPKYLATIISVSFFIMMIGNKLFSYTYLFTESKPFSFTYLIGIVVFGIVLLFLIIYLLIKISYYKNAEIALKKTFNS